MNSVSSFASDLAAVGVIAESPWDLVKTKNPYRSAIPVLLDWLVRTDYPVAEKDVQRFREGIVRSLAVKEARGIAGAALVREFRRVGATSGYRWAVGNSLEVVADDSVFDEVAKIAMDGEFGKDRQMMVLALSRMKNPAATDLLVQLLNDPDVAGHAAMALGRLKAANAKDALEDLAKTSNIPWIRSEAEKAVAKVSS